MKKKEFRRNRVLLNHEKIHIRQQAELLVIFFYLWYVLEYYYWLFRLKNPHHAYRRISFEREAYLNDSNLNYLKTRKLWSFWKYLKS